MTIHESRNGGDYGSLLRPDEGQDARRDLVVDQLREEFIRKRASSQTSLATLTRRQQEKASARSGMGPLRRRLSQIGDRFDASNDLRAEYEANVNYFGYLINAVDNGNLSPITDHLVSEINDDLQRAQIGVFLTEDRSSEIVWGEKAWCNIDRLKVLDPSRGSEMEAKILSKTGNPLN